MQRREATKLWLRTQVGRLAFWDWDEALIDPHPFPPARVDFPGSPRPASRHLPGCMSGHAPSSSNSFPHFLHSNISDSASYNLQGRLTHAIRGNAEPCPLPCAALTPLFLCAFRHLVSSLHGQRRCRVHIHRHTFFVIVFAARIARNLSVCRLSGLQLLLQGALLPL